MNVRCPVCGEAVALAVGDTRLACAACGLATPVSRIGTEPGTASAGVALMTLEADLTGTTLANRTIVERIGAGGMGTVYRARGEGADVAIKVLRPSLGTDRTAVIARFAREAAALRRLEHPRVVRLLDHGEEAGIAYIVTELVAGRDLAAALAGGRMTMTTIVDLFVQVCEGVAAAHAAGIVHRDLKPANILVGDDLSVKVADFGLAQFGPDAAITTLTRTDVAMGTFHYLAPEQRKDARGVDHRADIWALGVIFYEMLTGELPLGSFAPPSTRRPDDCDRRADAIVRRALAPDPADRFATVAELGRAVRALTVRRGATRVGIALAAIGVLTLGTVGVVAFSGGGGVDTPPVARAELAIDAALPVAADASVMIDAAVAIAAAPVDAAVPIDAAVTAVAVAPPVKLPTKTTVSKVSKPSVSKTPVSKAGGGKITKKPKGKAPDTGPEMAPDVAPVPAVCVSARRCCLAVKGSACGSFASASADTCESALVGFRDRATNPKQQTACR